MEERRGCRTHPPLSEPILPLTTHHSPLTNNGTPLALFWSHAHGAVAPHTHPADAAAPAGVDGRPGVGGGGPALPAGRQHRPDPARELRERPRHAAAQRG